MNTKAIRSARAQRCILPIKVIVDGRVQRVDVDVRVRKPARRFRRLKEVFQ